MCGFVALFSPGRVFDRRLLAAMGEDMRHRGPDGQAVMAEEGIGLAFRRLAVLDGCDHSMQPMTDDTGRYTIVFNGEIYNYRELRAELTSAGVVFHSTGDTEVLLQGYARWGESILDRLRGMYAFVIVDRVAGVAVAA